MRSVPFIVRALTCVVVVIGAVTVPLVHRGHVLAQQAATDAKTSGAGQAIARDIGQLRSLTDAVRAPTTAALARRIRALPPTAERLNLALSLANLSTEGDFGRATLQAVTDTLAQAVTGNWSGNPAAAKLAHDAYLELAALSRFEGMDVRVRTPAFTEALSRIDELTKVRARADFTLRDLSGATWTRSGLTGKVVLVNFWATWCPPCRQEMPDLDAIGREFASRGLVILAISDEPEQTVRTFLAEHPVQYPVLLDPGRAVSDALRIDSIPKTFIYDRSGRLVAQSIDMRTRGQFLALLAKAGLS